MKTVRCRIDTRHGMGGFLNPPGHPEYTISVETDLDRRSSERGGASLSAAVDTEWIDEETRKEAKCLLDHWRANRLAIESPEIQEWIHQVLGYYRGCYRNPNSPPEKQWHAGDVVIDNRDPMIAPAEHCGVRWIRTFYPAFEPTREHFERARWGHG